MPDAEQENGLERTEPRKVALAGLGRDALVEKIQQLGRERLNLDARMLFHEVVGQGGAVDADPSDALRGHDAEETSKEDEEACRRKNRITARGR